MGEIGWALKMACDFAMLACGMGQVGKWLEPVGLEDQAESAFCSYSSTETSKVLVSL